MAPPSTTVSTLETLMIESPPPQTRASSLATFGNRQLSNPEHVYTHNAWDGVGLTPDQLTQAQARIAQQQTTPAPPDIIADCAERAAEHWDGFYTVHANRFFKDRLWFRVEFPEIHELDRAACAQCHTCREDLTSHPLDSIPPSTLSVSSVPFSQEDPTIEAESKEEEVAPEIRPRHDTPARPVVWEVGCGAGNTIFPLLRTTDHLFIYGCDYSSVAVDVVRSSPAYDAERCHAFVYDITSPEPPTSIAPQSVDIITCVFVLSALHPSAWSRAVANLTRALKPGGLLLFRDYGRYDLAQLRFKAGRYLGTDNFYRRGDGTQVYFFSLDQVASLFGPPCFRILQNEEDKRLLVNRSKQLQMHRIWIQGKYVRV